LHKCHGLSCSLLHSLHIESLCHLFFCRLSAVRILSCNKVQAKSLHFGSAFANRADPQFVVVTHELDPLGRDENGMDIFRLYSRPNPFRGVQICPYLSLEIQHPIPHLYSNTQIYGWQRGGFGSGGVSVHPNPKPHRTPIRMIIRPQNQTHGYPKPALYGDIVRAIRTFYKHMHDIYTHIHMYKKKQ
jgi:hypothetical protein